MYVSLKGYVQQANSKEQNVSVSVHAYWVTAFVSKTENIILQSSVKIKVQLYCIFDITIWLISWRASHTRTHTRTQAQTNTRKQTHTHNKIDKQIRRQKVKLTEDFPWVLNLLLNCHENLNDCNHGKITISNDNLDNFLLHPGSLVTLNTVAEVTRMYCVGLTLVNRIGDLHCR